MAGVGDWRLLSRNPLTGVEEWWRWNGDGTCTIRKTQDVEPVLDRNQAMATHNDGWNNDKTIRRAAAIPNVVLDEYRRKGINLLRHEFKDELHKMLNDIDYRKLRTAHWRV